MDNTILQEDLIVDGNLVAKSRAISVGGKVTGDIKAQSVDVLRSGQVKGAVVAEHTTVAGVLEGSVSCTELTLAEHSKVKADIKAKTMMMSPGASIVGRVEIVGE